MNFPKRVGPSDTLGIHFLSARLFCHFSYVISIERLPSSWSTCRKGIYAYPSPNYRTFSIDSTFGEATK